MIANDVRRGKRARLDRLEVVDPCACSFSDGTKTAQVLSVTKDVPPAAIVAEALATIRRKTKNREVTSR
jgi:hypothetical protein